MDIAETKKITQDLLTSFHFSSLEDAGLTLLQLSCLAKLSEYKLDDQRFKKKYGISFELFEQRIDEKIDEECFEEEDDFMAWKYAHDALKYWEKKAKEIDKCF